MEALLAEVPAEAVPLRALQGAVMGLAVFRRAVAGDFADLRNKAEAIVTASPDDPLAIDALAISQLGTGSLAEAANTATLAIEKNNNDFFAYYVRALARSPGVEDLEASMEIRQTFTPVLVQLARVRIDAGQFEDAKKLLEDVLRRAPDHAEALQLLNEIV